MSTALKKIPDNKVYQLHDWQQLPDNQKADLIDGKIYLQSAPSKEHSLIQGDLRSVLHPLRANKLDDGSFEKNKWIFATEVGVIYDDCACTHDLAGWKSERLQTIGDKTHINIIPDWVCEIVSTNWKSDTIIKRNLLEKQKVPYYWIITPHDYSIIVLELTKEGFYQQWGIVDINNQNLMIPPFYSLELRPKDIFNY